MYCWGGELHDGLKLPIEIGKVAEARFEGDLRDILLVFNQQFARIADAHLQEELPVGF